jgi:hypothetical protein
MLGIYAILNSYQFHEPDDSYLRHPRQDVLLAVFAAVKFSEMRRKWRLLRSLRVVRVYF